MFRHYTLLGKYQNHLVKDGNIRGGACKTGRIFCSIPKKLVEFITKQIMWRCIQKGILWRRLSGCSTPQNNHGSKHIFPQQLLVYNFSIVHFLICSFKITSGNSKVICHRVKSRHCMTKNNHHLIPNIRGSDYYHLPFTIPNRR